MLLFLIVFVSFIFTMVIENKDPLDSLVMVSNAFTSNGYAILGDTPGGKINSVILVWSGYIISGVATATLAVAIILRDVRQQMNEYKIKLTNFKPQSMSLKISWMKGNSFRVKVKGWGKRDLF